MKLLKVLSGSLGFFTLIPSGDPRNFNEFIEHLEIIPLTGALIGVVLGAVVYLLSYKEELLILFPLIYVLVEGINHLDGLSDFADGVCASGDREKKIKAMKDVSTGSGGVTALIIYLILLTYSIFIIDSPDIRFFSIILSQSYSKLGILILLFYGNPIHPGLAEMFSKKVTARKVLTGLAIAILVGLLWFPESLIALTLSILLTYIILKIARKHFGGISGDVAGALNCVIFAGCLLTFGVLS